MRTAEAATAPARSLEQRFTFELLIAVSVAAIIGFGASWLQLRDFKTATGLRLDAVEQRIQTLDVRGEARMAASRAEIDASLTGLRNDLKEMQRDIRELLIRVGPAPSPGGGR